jgi:predicted anti-sigma-YlaC factor YlaD
MDDQGCGALLDELSLFLDGEATEALCAEIEHHMAGCEDCRVVVDTLRKTLLLYRNLPAPNLPDEARQRLYRSVDLEEYLA